MEAHQSQAPGHADLDPIHPGSGRDQGLLKRFGGAAAAVGLLLVKFGAKLKVLLFALPKLKLFTTSASMLVSIVAYQLIFGWAFSVGFVVLLLLHEMGHAWIDENVTDSVRERFLEMRGLRAWNETTVPWDDRGYEHGAEIIAWGLGNRYMAPSIPDRDPARLAAGFELLTATPVPNPKNV